MIVLPSRSFATSRRFRAVGYPAKTTGLKGVWDEICVQVQYEQSVYWDDYEDLARSSVAHHVAELAQHEREALWLQTDEGSDWLYEEKFRLRESIRREVCLEFDLLVQLPIWIEDHSAVRDDRHDGYPVTHDDIVSYLLDRVLSQAADWTNRRIRAYIDRRYEYD